MPEERKKILIGYEYRDTYANLIRILESGCLKNSGARVETRADGSKVICTDGAEYVYGERSAGAGNVAVRMGADGASWFAPIRCGKAFDDGTSEWKQLVYRVARDFHDEYSIIEYKRCDGSGSVNADEVEENIGKLVNRLFGRKDFAILRGGDKGKGSEDIFGASVKLELSGTGQSHYVVMCKIFFRRTSVGVFPISGTEAERIYERLEDAPDNDEPVRLTPEESGNINSITVNAVRDLVEGRFPVSFKESLCFSKKQTVNRETGKAEDNYDLKTYKALAARACANAASVTCTSIQVLGISHVEWINDYYEVAFGGKVYLQAIVGFGGSLTLRCANCGGANLVTSNSVSYKITNEDGLTRTVNKTFDYSRPDLGITDGELAELKKYSEFANHLLSVGCFNARMGKQCTSCVCRSQTVNVDGVMKCADCPYPEVVYTDYSGERPVRYSTSKLTFVNDRLAMVLAENAGKCLRCGRMFSREALIDGKCPLCSDIEGLSGAKKEAAKRRYRRYRNAFSYGVRLNHLFDDKVCLEDDTALVFALGRDTYVLDKSGLTAGGGFIAQPARIK